MRSARLSASDRLWACTMLVRDYVTQGHEEYRTEDGNKTMRSSRKRKKHLGTARCSAGQPSRQRLRSPSISAATARKPASLAQTTPRTQLRPLVANPCHHCTQRWHVGKTVSRNMPPPRKVGCVRSPLATDSVRAFGNVEHDTAAW